MNPNNAAYIKRIAHLEYCLRLMLDAFKISKGSTQLAARRIACAALEAELAKGSQPPKLKSK